MALGGCSMLKNTTMLEQLLEEINFQRTKEMRQLLKDESGFIVLQGTTYWTDLFVRHFLFQEEQAIDCDDLLFFVRKRHVRGSSRHLPKYETEVEVFRKDSKKLPIGDPEVDWEETVYLNLVVHQFDYTLTLAICTRTSPKELQVLRRHSQKVYASPSRRKMDSKGEGEEITYPHICFMVDNFDEVFCDIVVRDGEMVCVELVARGRGSGAGSATGVAGGGTGATAQAVIFLGSIRYDALTRVYESRKTSVMAGTGHGIMLSGGLFSATFNICDSKQSSLSTKVAQRMSFGLLGGKTAARCEFVRMKGPAGKGHAEMAMTRADGPGGAGGADTPLSEPGRPATDLWDSDWEDDPEEMYLYRHQRRLSDPSANINMFGRGGWRTREDKSRSENEGLDSLVHGIAEVEAGDLRDVVSQASSAPSGPCAPSGGAPRPPCAAPRMGVPPGGTCPSPALSPACLQYVTHRPLHTKLPSTLGLEQCEMADDAGSLEEKDFSNTHTKMIETDSKDRVVRGKEELPCYRELHIYNAMKKEDRPERGGSGGGGAQAYCTLPRQRAGIAAILFKKGRLPPKRTTPDGTDIYYWCDMPKRKWNELDDGLCHPVWGLRGFTQSFHVWKEGRRQQSAPLHAYLTYVTLPWWTIAKDILDHREEPILTF